MLPTTISQNVLGQFGAVTKLIAEAHIRSDERAKAAHERFNVFTTLLKEHDEVRLHTRFIHCLLNPEGCHDCGPLFLGLFFDTLAELPGADHKDIFARLDIPISEKHWTVRKEFPCPPYGQIDLLLERPGFGIAIENKINAAEQHRQLACYAEYLRKRHGDAARLVYLTKDGKASASHGEAPYIRISYAEHILAWLEKCLHETYRIIPINQVLLQYREVVRQLTGKTMESESMKPICHFITQHPDIVRFRKEINDGIDAVRADFLDRMADGIINELKEQSGFIGRLRPNLREGRFGKDPYGAFILTPPADSVLHNAPPSEVWVQRDQDWNVLCVGLTITDRPDKASLPPAHHILFEQMKELLIDANARNYDKPDATPTWPTTPDWPTGWRNLIYEINDDERLAELITTPLPETIAKVCKDIRSYIALLEEVYTKAIQSTNIQP